MTQYTLLNSSQKGPPRSSKIFFVVLCIAVSEFILYINTSRNFDTELDEQIIQEALNNPNVDPYFANLYRTKTTSQDIKNNLKFILLWTPKKSLPFNFFGIGQNVFIRNKCEFTNCYVTADRGYFKSDVTKFDAIFFNGRDMRYIQPSDLPQQRSAHQKYVFFNVESSTYQPVCNPWWDDFFNWTSTYKLNSDIIYSYIYIRDKDGKHVGPRIDMDWIKIKDMKEIDDTLKKKLKSKKNAVAWFVSHCITRSKREKYVKSLQNALEHHGLTVDIYGQCGNLKCRWGKRCFDLIASDYYFYLSFENAFAEDYVTEKLLTPLNNDAVPIVMGGSNYTRFLPPGSYIDARQHEPATLASTIAGIIADPTTYHEFFRWRNHYSYSESEQIEDVCNLCTALNDETMVTMKSTYPHFRSWWNPDWEERCQEENWST